MIRIQMIRGNTCDPDRRKRHPSRASCEAGGRRYEATGPAPNYRLMTLLWLHGHGGERFEVWGDRDPFGKSSGLAMRGRLRNWASLETPNGKPIFKMQSQPDPNFTPEQRATVAKAAGVVVSRGADSRGKSAPGCATHPSDGPRHPQEQDDAPAAIVGARTPEAA